MQVEGSNYILPYLFSLQAPIFLLNFITKYEVKLRNFHLFCVSQWIKIVGHSVKFGSPWSE